MIRNILTFGDSFTYGEELSDNKSAWPYIVARRCDATVQNFATPGGSNDQIVRKFIRVLSSDKIPLHNSVQLSKQLIIIGWSIPGRTEFHDQEGFFDVWPARSGRIWMDPVYSHRHQLTKYVSLYHNDSSFYEKFLQQIIIVQTLAKNYGLKCLMLNIMQNDYYKTKTDFLTDPDNGGNSDIAYATFDDYDKKIDKKFFIDWGVGGMMEWVPENSPKGPNGHFLEPGHIIVAAHVHEAIRNLGWVS
jgi:hypothetical protein